MFCLHESQTDSWVSLLLIFNHCEQTWHGGEGIRVASGLEYLAWPSGHPVKVTGGGSTSTLALGTSSQTWVSCERSRYCPFAGQPLLFPQGPSVICTSTSLLRNRPSTPFPLCHQREKTLSRLEDLKLYSLETDLQGLE